jgi:hypothetical protein
MLRNIAISISEAAVLILLTPTFDTFLVVKRAILCILLAFGICTVKRLQKCFDIEVNNYNIIFGIGVGILLGCNFYGECSGSKVEGIIGRFGINPKFVLMGCSLVGAVVSIPILTICGYWIVYYIRMGMDIIRNGKNRMLIKDGLKIFSVKQSFLILTGIYWIGISSIIRADFNYIDDLARVAQGYKGWGKLGRITSNVLATFVHMDNYLTDISPLPQLISAVIVALAGVLMLVIVYERDFFSIVEILSVVPLYLNPYFLECISFKFDSPYMALSVFSAVFPLLYRRKNVLAYIVISSIGTLLMCTTYQASSGIYPMLVVLLMLIMWNRGEAYKETINFGTRSFIGYSIGILVFKIFCMVPLNDDNSYISTSLPRLDDLFPNIVSNLENYYTLIVSDFKKWWLFLVFALMVCFVISVVNRSRHKHWQAMMVSVTVLICLGLLCFGLYPLLRKPLFRPRAMYGFGIMIVLLAVCVVENVSFVVGNVVTLVLGWAFFLFAFTYGNALTVQKEYTEFRVEQVIDSINDLEALQSGKDVVVQIAGNIGLSPILDEMPQNYQMLNKLIPATFSSGSYYGEYRFYNYYNLKNVVWNSDIDLTTYELPLLENHMYYSIYGNESYILVELK